MSRKIGQSSSIAPDFKREAVLWQMGLSAVAGVDEVGRGPLAGPVMAGAVVFPAHASYSWLKEVRDSKLLSAGKRNVLARLIRESAEAGMGIVAPADVDEMGISKATQEAMLMAVGALPRASEYILVDGFPMSPCPLPQEAIIKGDVVCLSIACASIVAKVERDALMEEMDALYPGYGFAHNKGYATEEHCAALARFGPCPIHRRSFAPVKALLKDL